MSQEHCEDLNQLHNTIQDCFKYLDQRIYRAVNHQPLSRTVIVEKDNANLVRECEDLRKQMKLMQNQYDMMCGKLGELQKKILSLRQNNEIQKQEIETQGEILKKKKLSILKPRYEDTEEQQINIYKSLKAYIKNNESNFSLFLGTILHARNTEKYIDLNDLLVQVERYYRPPKSQKFQIQSVERVKFPQIQMNRVPSHRVEKIKYKINSALNNYDHSQSTIVGKGERSISFQ